MIPQRKALLDFLEAYTPYEKQIRDMLSDMSIDAARSASRIAGPRGIQAAMAAKIGNVVQQDFYQQMYPLIMNGQIDMSLIAADMTQDFTDDLLSGFGMSEVDLAVMRDSLRQTAASGIGTAVTRMTGSQRPLSSRVYRTATGVGSSLDRTINSAIAQGKSAREIAKDVYDYISPDTPGGASYAANRLARTELNNAYHASARKQYAESPFSPYVEWALSGSHGKSDVCDDYAGDIHVPGQDPGVYKSDSVPDKPHPQCLCYISPVPESDEEFLNRLTSGEYDDYLEQTTGKTSTGLFGQRGGSKNTKKLQVKRPATSKSQKRR